MRMRIKKGDTVKIMRGKDRGKSGKVLRVSPEKDRIVVENVNMYLKHVRPKQQGEKGQTIEVSRPLSASNVMLVCPACHRATRIGFRTEGERKTRYCRKCRAGV